METLAKGAEERQGKAFGAAFPFYESRLAGLPNKEQFLDYGAGKTARAFGPARAATSRRLAFAGVNPTDPAYLQTMTDLEGQQGRAFDDQISQFLNLDEATKQSAARGLMGGASLNDPLRALQLLLQAQLA